MAGPRPAGRGDAATSPCSTENQPSGSAAHGAPGGGDLRRARRRVARPSATQLAGEGGGGDPVGPHAAPPRPVRRGGEAPGRRERRLDVGGAGRVRPGQQPAPGVGLAAVGARRAGRTARASGRDPRRPGATAKRAVVAVACRDQASGPRHPRASRAALRPGRRRAGAPGGRARRRTARRRASVERVDVTRRSTGPSTPWPARARRGSAPAASSVTSSATTSPRVATSRARSAVMVPGTGARRRGDAGHAPQVRQEVRRASWPPCASGAERRTASAWPWVYVRHAGHPTGSAGRGALDVVGVVRLHPGHQLAQLATGLLDRVRLTLLAELGELRASRCPCR